MNSIERKSNRIVLTVILLVSATVLVGIAILLGSLAVNSVSQQRRIQAAVNWVNEQKGLARTDAQRLSRVSGQSANNQKVSMDSAITQVVLRGKHVRDISPVAEFKGLKELWLDDTQVTDLSPLEELVGLEKITLTITPVSDIAPLARMKNLRRVLIVNTEVRDLSPMSEWANLDMLVLKICPVQNLSPLSSLKRVKDIKLIDIPVIDLASIRRS